MSITINRVINYVIDACKHILIFIPTSQCALGLSDSEYQILDVKNGFRSQNYYEYLKILIDLFHATGHFLYPLKIPESTGYRIDQWHEMG